MLPQWFTLASIQLMKTTCFILLLSTLPAVLKACGCDTMNFKSAIEADEIFIGQLYKVESINTHETYIHLISLEEEDYVSTDWIYYFKISKKWKGSSSDIAVLGQPSSCAYPFEITTHPYLVYGYHSDNLLPHIKELLFGKEVGTFCGIRTTPASFYVYSEDNDNWFDTDTMRLNQTFPKPVKLTSYKNRLFAVSTGLAIFLLAGFVLIRRWKKQQTTQSQAPQTAAH